MFSNDFLSQNKSEKGRSLIEIIAILIILAILLIAALIGFKALLDYLKKKETAQQISTIGMRYKTDRLGKIRKGDQKVSLKEVYPEGIECSKNDSTCVKTPDGGKIQVYAYPDTTSFIIVATNIQAISCEEAIMAGGYTKVANEIGNNVLDFINSDMVFNSATGQFQDLQYFREHPDKLLDFCQSGIAFIYTDSTANCEHFYDGKCHACPRGKIEDRLGKCCEELKECGLCPPGCPTKTPKCKDDNLCVECLEYTDCPENKPYCDLRTGTCRPCKNIGEACRDSSGAVIGGMFCNKDLECEKMCEGKSSRWKPDPKNMSQCICDKKTRLNKGEMCDVDTDSTCQDECNFIFECKGALYNKTCQCYDTTKVNAPCSDKECPCGKLEDGTQLICRNAKCINPNDESVCIASGLLPIDQRNKDKSCKYDPNCPCNDAAQNLLSCESGRCSCSNLPIKKDADCWGECGCGTGLQCSETGAKIGKCECDPATQVGAFCSPECGCAAGLKCNDEFKCECDPPEGDKSLPAGADCAGEEECPQQCQTTLCMRNGKTKKCCPEPGEPWCDDGSHSDGYFNANGCLEHESFSCPASNDPNKKYCNSFSHQCVECRDHNDCPTGKYCQDNICVDCNGNKRCANTKNPVDEYIFQRCKFTCPRPTDTPDKKKCDTDEKNCVGCLQHTDCPPNFYCEDKTCVPCVTQTCEGVECCQLDGPKDACNHPTPKTYWGKVTYGKKVGDNCETVTEDYCTLGPKPKDECKTCNSPNVQCGLKDNGEPNCCPVCNSAGNACCKSHDFINGAGTWDTTTSFKVDSQKNMKLKLDLAGITSFTEVSACEETSCTKYTAPAGYYTASDGKSYGKLQTDIKLTAGHTYTITIKFTNKCASCSIRAVCS